MCVVRAGDEALFVAPLPLALLEPPPEATARLACWGIHRAGELAALPRLEVALRLGEEGVRLHRLACGETAGEFIPDPLRETLKEAVVVEHPLVDLEMFLFVLHGVLSRLADRLDLRGEGFAELLLDLHLEGGKRLEARTKMVAPTREVAAVLALVRLQLEARPPGAPVEGITAIVTPGKVRLSQGSLFGPSLPAPGKLARTLARLTALVGPERVGAALVPDTHRPGAWGVVPFAPGQCGEREEGRGERGRARGERGKIPDPGPRTPDPGLRAPVLRAFRLPREARVVTAGERPVVVRVDRLGGAVVGCAGPYRFIGEWWTESPLARDDFDVATADGALLRVHFDRLQRTWFADGVYD
jgi:protein ImuB